MMHCVTISGTRDESEKAALAMESLGVSVSLWEVDEKAARWQATGYFDGMPEADRLIALFKAYGIASPDLDIAPLPDKDWLAENRRSFTPIAVGRFFIIPSDYEGEIPPHKIVFKIDAAQAFGTGRHATTQGCLELLDEWHDSIPKNILDLGTGTGVLAMAAAAIFNAPVLATDIDDIATRHARENVEKNGVENVICATADGLDHSLIRERAPYNLIIANILAEPLLVMAQDIKSNLAPQGQVILSGFLDTQMDAILRAYQPLSLRQVFEQGEWRAVRLA